MCEYCGCREVPAIAELMDEHTALADEGHYVRQALGTGDFAGAMRLLGSLVAHLDRHVRREEDGIFLAMRAAGEFIDDLDTHVEREDLGIFPVSVVTLGASGWATVDVARRGSPSFLLDVASTTTADANAAT